ncbi:MAG: PilZ domain-containing protein [Candidatus Rokubacteria bacterium]|nr:PilZ domain-containing protein [Candidatus Rokubacteria bacterium]
MGRDRRRYPRVGVALDISVEVAGRRWDAKTVDLSPYGVKVALPASAIRPSEGTSVNLQLTVPDSADPLSIKSMVWRREPKSTILIFVELHREQLERLKGLVELLQAAPA